MKKTLLFLAAAASFGTASAQKMGDIFVYGSIGYTDNRSKTNSPGLSVETDHYREFSVLPGIGYQFNSNWAVGLTGEMTAIKNKAPYNVGNVSGLAEGKASSTYIGPFVRYTRNLSNLFFVFGQFNAMYLRTNESVNIVGGSTVSELEGNGVTGRLFPALGINVTRTLSVVGTFGDIRYEHLTRNAAGSSASTNTDYKDDNLTATFGRNFTLGVQWNFGTTGRRANMQPMDETRRMDTSDDSDDMPRPPAPPRRRRGRD